MKTKTPSSAWATFKHVDLGQSWTRADRIRRHLAETHGDSSLAIPNILSQLVGPLDGADQIALELLIFSCALQRSSGSTRLNLEFSTLSRQFKHHLMDIQEVQSIDIDGLTRRALSLLESPSVSGLFSKTPGEGAPFIIRSHWLHEANILSQEVSIADMLMNRLVDIDERPPYDPAKQAALSHLTDEQSQAVSSSLSHALSLVSGGPGTGKTSIVVGIIIGALHSGRASERITMAAPTGKAAWRMGDSVRSGLASLSLPLELPEPRTLHRLLEYQPHLGRFGRHRGYPIDADVVIVDEASMIDTDMMYHLLDAVAPEANLVLLGDAEQLPSVGAGAIFENMAACLSRRCVTLTRNFRMREDDPDGSSILSLARAIRQGAPSGDGHFTNKDAAGELEWRGVERLELNRETADDFARVWQRKFTVPAERALTLRRDSQSDLTRAFDLMESSRILCSTRGGLFGVERWNERIHILHAHAVQMSAQQPFLPGEGVMMTRNDYAHGLFNGDQGLVVTAEGGDPNALDVVFRTTDGFRHFPLDRLREDIELCHAMTVHKSQGSEFDRAAILVPEDDSFGINRRLLYTGVTRSRRSVILLGSDEAINLAIKRRGERNSTLSELITERLSQTGESEV